MKKNKQPLDNQITIYQSPGGGMNVEVLYADENIWLTQKLIAQLFDCSIDNVSLHLKNIFTEGELDPGSVIEEYSTTATDRKEYKTKHYSLEAIVAVGYRVNLDYAEMQAARRKAMTMKDWAEKLNAFLKFSEYEILTNVGKISHEVQKINSFITPEV